METRAFGTIRLEDGQATLPVGPGLLRPAGLDMLATLGDRVAMAAAAEFLDALPKHLATVRQHLMDGLDTAPERFASLFPELATSSATPADRLWTSLDLRSVWTDNDATVTLEFARDGAEDGPVLAAAFALDGTLRDLAVTA
ncbi:hypothetical protein [Rhodovulum strictum]|uniref:Uncharacterized protein n=1 Tax=Rhodovulum strictum TaxID=58314 RepID=A0A844BGD5_9RHOB|nr:hypothetical protein [Rhodovulum strictum]MRH21649.1 hypothetical protein [Rhodovulum strictum]